MAAAQQAESGASGPRRDRGVAALLGLLGALTLVVGTAVVFRSPAELARALLSPLTVTAAQANWVGVLSATLMLLQTLGLARLPWLERAWGRATLTRWHRRLGWWSWWSMVLHVLLFALQRALRDPDDLGRAMLDLFVREPWMWAASAGTLALVVVTATSVGAVRRRLRHERWHLVHLWAYVGMGLVLPHMLLGPDLTGWAAAYWWGFYLLTLAAVLVFRVGVPLVRSGRHRLRVLAVTPEADGATSVTVGGRDLDRLRVRAGQFGTWWLGVRGGPHPYSFSAAPRAKALRVTVGGRGDGARRVAGLRPGRRVLLEGPYGAPLLPRRRHDHVLLLAAGSGITPVRAWLEEVGPGTLAPGEVTVVHRVGDASRRLLAAEVDALAAAHEARVVVLAGPRRADGAVLPVGVEGDAVEVLRAMVPDLPDVDVVVCGPPGWVGVTAAVLRRAGVRRRDLRREEFGW